MDENKVGVLLVAFPLIVWIDTSKSTLLSWENLHINKFEYLGVLTSQSKV